MQQLAPSQTFDVAKLTLTSLEKHGLEATPVNYRLWFTHHSGSNPGLSRALQALETGGTPITDAQTTELYEQFFAPEPFSQSVYTTGSRLETVLSRLLTQTGVAQKETQAFKEMLETVGVALLRESENGLMRHLMAMQQETQLHAQRLARLEEELAQSDSEMAALRQALEEARREAETDALTGIANRRSLDQSLTQLVLEAQETGLPLTLMLLDIDHFKKFNDLHGHKAGDLVLRLVATKLRQMVKGRDVVARFGGEEFTIILPETDLAGGLALAEKIRLGIARNQIVLKRTGRSLGTVTLSVGVAEYHNGEDVEVFIERADKNLYAAKSAGRNRVVGEH